MCKISSMLLPAMNYWGLIVRMQQGHIFYPFDVARNSDGTLIPMTGNSGLSPEYNCLLRFYSFKKTLSDAIALSSDTEPSELIEDFHGNKEQLKERILKLNRQANLPGLKVQEPTAVTLSLAA
jgi:hypothetical protein